MSSLIIKGIFTMLKSIEIVTGFEDVPVMGNTIEQDDSHFFITEDLHPFSEVEIGSNIKEIFSYN